MEKEKDGLFGRLVHFWKEKIWVQGEGGIGFWKDEDNVENHFAEMGAVAALSQKEMKGAFWQEKAERQTTEMKPIYIVPEMEKVFQKAPVEDMEGKAEQSQRVFVAERFLAEKAKTPDGYENTADKTRKKRYIIPVTEEKTMKQENEDVLAAGQEQHIVENFQKEEKNAEKDANVEQLMKEITKRLWEEREGCGRRLR